MRSSLEPRILSSLLLFGLILFGLLIAAGCATPVAGRSADPEERGLSIRPSTSHEPGAAPARQDRYSNEGLYGSPNTGAGGSSGAGSSGARSGLRVALLMDNASYKYTWSLLNPPEDIALLTETLRRPELDFSFVNCEEWTLDHPGPRSSTEPVRKEDYTSSCKDLDKGQMLRAFASLKDMAPDADVLLV